jgi:peptidoglycan hydrolase CwlO-like protein
MVKRATSSVLSPRAIAGAGLAAAIILLGLGSPAPHAAGLGGKIDAKSKAAHALQNGIATDNHRISAATRALRTTERRLAGLQNELDARTAELVRVKNALLDARTRLTQLENRLGQAIIALGANLRQTYEGDHPDWMTVVFESRGFADLLERLQFLDRIRNQDVQIVRDVRAARTAVLAQATRLGALEVRDQHLEAEVLARRNEVAKVREALVRQRMAALSRRAHKAARLHALRHQLAKLLKRQARLARVPGVQINTGGLVQAPAGAPPAVARVIAAGNAIAALPYRYGGGHGSFHDNAYDCSGSVSYALAAGGLLSSPLTSGAFESWGASGAGRWITVYANSGHAFMMVAGWRFDTSALGSGTRWQRGSRDTAGFAARHPPGL